ncbi:hypothetical protein CEXT_665651 [Caerostris extrusa]|uniref:Uncharacterized protein n=1 Tax=Caerostris extrusa TaxID=172846 RepID=A0AAV4Y1R4_CAEEX|nr:hypothetical protein CEXT_665651 [Caerostris extrusa]
MFHVFTRKNDSSTCDMLQQLRWTSLIRHQRRCRIGVPVEMSYWSTSGDVVLEYQWRCRIMEELLEKVHFNIYRRRGEREEKWFTFSHGRRFSRHRIIDMIEIYIYI